jgi:hypothetical protein
VIDYTSEDVAARARARRRAGARFACLFMRPDAGELEEIARWDAVTRAGRSS